MAARILIADDNPTMRTALRTLLERRPGWQVCCEASNGQQAVQGVAALKPDLAILDLTMPVMDGLQAAREISSLYPEVAILMHTNHASDVLARQAEKLGIRKIVSKGDREDDIVATIEALLGAIPEIAGAGGQAATIVNTEKAPVLGEAAKASGGTE